MDVTCSTHGRDEKFIQYFKVGYEGVFKSFRTGHLERELQTVQLALCH